MSKNKKKFKKRSIEEARKAQLNVSRGNLVPQSYDLSNKKPSPATSAQKSSTTLPIPEIKKDLIKNLIFAAASVVLLLILSYTKFGYSQLAPFFRI